MEAARLRPLFEARGSIRAGIVALIAALALIAWLLSERRMSGMDAGPGTDLGSLGGFAGIWIVMMAAMMLPSVWPMVLLHARIRAGREQPGPGGAVAGTMAVLAGYLLTWGAAGVAAYWVVEGVDALGIGALAWDQAGRFLAGGVIIAAAGYQLTPLKDRCLRYCRTPLDFLLHHWHSGTAGALRIGAEHGAWCVGCCWMLMAALFAVGVMSLFWMAVIAGLIAIEKLLPWKALANRGIAVALVVLALGVAFWSESVPELTVPGSPAAQQAMEAMGMERPGPSRMPAGMSEQSSMGMRAEP